MEAFQSVEISKMVSYTIRYNLKWCLQTEKKGMQKDKEYLWPQAAAEASSIILYDR